MVWRVIGIVFVVYLVGMIFPEFTRCYPSREGDEAIMLAQTLDMYSHATDVGLPKKWEEVADLLSTSRFSTAEPAKRYAILEHPLPVNRLGKNAPFAAEILVLQRRNVYDAKRGEYLKGPGRYVIYRRAAHGESSRRLRAAWLTAEEVRTAFQSAGRALPLPDHEPARPEVVEAWSLLILNWTWKSILVVWALVDIILRVRRWLAESAPPPDGVELAMDRRLHAQRQHFW